ncbi:MAG: PilZ domain-containing protein [Myxococcota bacterium]|nr:PilZ domain-containing protein [Myxococcota bacterium]
MAEKRDSPRQKVRVHCEINAGNRRGPGRVVDLSVGGLAVQTELALKKGAKLRVELVVPGRDPVVVEAVVANSRKLKNKVTGRSTRVAGLIVENPGLGFLALAQTHQTQAHAQPSVRRTSFVRR